VIFDFSTGFSRMRRITFVPLVKFASLALKKMEAQAIKFSPLHQIEQQAGAIFGNSAGWQVVEHFGDTAAEQTAVLHQVGLVDLSANGKIMVQGEQAETAVATLLQNKSLAINQGANLGDGLEVYRLRRDQFMVFTQPGDEKGVMEQLETAVQSMDGLITVTDVTHGRAQIGLLGPQSAELLSRLCGLDFHPSVFPPGTAKQTSVAKTTQLVICHDIADTTAYSVIGGRSLAAYLWETILDAGLDLGVRPVGAMVARFA
jgi:heterotetrameric sarcosine oxidase gamma subunit